ncbi:hypothetical protein [Nonomuraea sp. NEAU-A123]|uniref:hypothetical protein n=1 Tax=Nonomuraea sp. NEAU-A123 TaxID=2839649 RepID=UPI001BE4C3B8|nr:hypothetical protein [Nonomuraea sp. NEAU-A123]MBT2233281.1 hypothetical protein [Nonomuraea sp. NEAU-A123]
MRHTESDLRQFLTEFGQDPAGGEPSAHLDAIVRRGRRIRRTRRALTAGAAMAVAVTAAGLVNGLPAGPPRADKTSVAQRPADSAQVDPGPKLPASFPVVLGAEKFDLPLAYSQRFATMGVGRTVIFTPTSFSTGYKVVCDDPQAWVVIEGRGKGGEPSGTAGRCKTPVGGHHDQLSAPTDWLKHPQSLQIWVFPADASIFEAAKAVKDCKPTLKSKGCDENTVSSALRLPEVRERLSAEVGERPGNWAVGVYDRPAGAE